MVVVTKLLLLVHQDSTDQSSESVRNTGHVTKSKVHNTDDLESWRMWSNKFIPFAKAFDTAVKPLVVNKEEYVCQFSHPVC
jgi:hypothetical protein